ncbi:MAG: hypothetical protein Q7T60_03350 [Sphingopyxis sp.]|nr:hypothetical protein [Sphingopyxis sp.]
MTPLIGRVLDISHGPVAVDPLRVETYLGNLERALADGRVTDARDLLAAIGNRPL